MHAELYVHITGRMKYHKIKSIIENLCLYINSLILFDEKERKKRKENLSHLWKESSVTPVYKGHTAERSNHRGKSRLKTV